MAIRPAVPGDAAEWARLRHALWPEADPDELVREVDDYFAGGGRGSSWLLAEAAFVGIFPHLMGSPVNLAAYVQLDAAIPNYALMESGTTALNEIVDEPLVAEAGYVRVPDRPGIGVELREGKLAQFPYRPHRIAPATRADGAIAH